MKAGKAILESKRAGVVPYLGLSQGKAQTGARSTAPLAGQGANLPSHGEGHDAIEVVAQSRAERCDFGAPKQIGPEAQAETERTPAGSAQH
jgi:hypothetical protein